MLTVIFCRDGEPISDFDAREFAKKKIDEYKDSKTDMTVKVSTEIILMAFLLAEVKHEIPSDEIEYYEEDRKIQHNDEDGLMGTESGAPCSCIYAGIVEEVIDVTYKTLKERGKI